jgi:hypothetical protein
MRLGSGWVLLLAGLSLGCDHGREPFEEAEKQLAQEDLLGSAERYDAVCVADRSSKYCSMAVHKAAELRLQAAEQALREKRFADAREAAQLVVDKGDKPTQARATNLLASDDLVFGLRWRAVETRLSNRRAVMAEVEQIAASSGMVAREATNWINKERPLMLLEDARAICDKEDLKKCIAACKRLATLHPAAPEAAFADQLARYRTLMDAEQLLVSRYEYAQCLAREAACRARMPYTTSPDQALALCKQRACVWRGPDAPGFEQQWGAIVEQIADGETRSRLDGRWRRAMGAIYKKESPPAPAFST